MNKQYLGLYTAVGEMPALCRRLLPAAALGLAGCAGMSGADCATADWERIGEADGDRGRPVTYIEKYVEACAGHGLEPDREAWALGHAGGLDDYCSIDGGVAAGRRGDHYQGLCEPGFEEDFLAGFRAGRAIGHAENNLRKHEQRLRQLRFELDRRDLPDELRSRLQLDYFHAERRISAERTRIEQLRRQIEALKRGR